MTLQDSLQTTNLSLTNFLSFFNLFFPKIILALIILGVGVSLGYLFKRFVEEISQLISFEKHLSTFSGYQKVQKVERNLSLTSIASNLAWWITVFVFLFPALAVLGYSQASGVLSLFTNYLPALVTGSLILTIGSVFAYFSKQILTFVGLMLQAEGTRLIASFVSFVILIFSLNLALIAFGLKGQTYQIVVIGTVAATSLAAGLAGKEVFADIVKRIRDNFK